MTPQQVAAAENVAVRRAWGETIDSGVRTKNVALRIREYIGSGLTSDEVARRIGCTRQSVNAALRKIGGKL
ncbi:hypothetical protein [Sulfitobacter faviae]|uniref:hypothetical protein n=1 Tax=Sulfitobacter faviae TaxID=1775881 RepID=UPI0024569E25|nr:hypothetical protein [Sulfitobacter faviae]MDH4541044.1 hypothetical protein [Sulfitobacter faviae]